MPNELNPCAKCGASPLREEWEYRDKAIYTVYCPACDNEITDAKYTQADADAAWNAANPINLKEDEHHE